MIAKWRCGLIARRTVSSATSQLGVSMGLASGVHHLAITTADIKAQLKFFTDVLGAELKALYWMHGVPGAKHAFIKLNDSSYVAFVHLPPIEDIPTEIGVTHRAVPAGLRAPGTMQHVAFNVDSLENLLAMRDRIRNRGINVFGPLNHGLCHSIYFAGPSTFRWKSLPLPWRSTTVRGSTSRSSHYAVSRMTS